MPNLFTYLFVSALTASLALRLWLALRQQAHVRMHRCEVPAPFRDEIPVAAHGKAADYTVAKAQVGIADMVLAYLLALAWTIGGGVEVLSQVASSGFPVGSPGHGILVIAGFTLIGAAFGLPVSLYRTFVVEQRFGFNRMTLATYAGDLLKQALLAALVGIPVLLAVLWIMEAGGHTWWLYLWLFWAGFNLLVLLIYPVFIAPLFNRFTPLEDATLRERIEHLLARCGFRSSGLYVMDGSRRTGHGNAYFTGFGGSKRIVLFDTLLERLQPAEVEAVLAHELGHYRLNHIGKRIVLLFAGGFALMAVLGWVAQSSWFHTGLGVQHPSHATTLLLFSLALPAFTFPLAPLFSWLSRKQEFEADAYAIRYSTAADLRSALVKLYRENAATLTPDPLHSRFYDSHPPAIERIARLQSA